MQGLRKHPATSPPLPSATDTRSSAESVALAPSSASTVPSHSRSPAEAPPPPPGAGGISPAPVAAQVSGYLPGRDPIANKPLAPARNARSPSCPAADRSPQTPSHAAAHYQT